MTRQYRDPSSAGQDHRQFPSRGRRYPSPWAMSMAARRSTSPLPSSSCTRHAACPFGRGPQRLLAGGREADEPGYQGGEGAELIAARPDPGRLGPARLACGEPAEVVASVPVAIRSGEPHGGDRAGPDGTRALQAPLERGGENQVPAAAERQPGQHVGLGAGERRAGYLPGRSCAVVHPVAGRADDRPGPGRRRRRRPRCSRFAVLPVPGGTPPATAYPAPSRSVPRQPRASGQQVRRMGLAAMHPPGNRVPAP